MNIEAKYKEESDYIRNEVDIIIQNLSTQIGPKYLSIPYKFLFESGGKRIRPIITYLCAGIFDSEPVKFIKSAVSIELLHNFTLVHDDIMDKSPLRRGRQTIHTKWDDSTAILLGDTILAFAYDLLDENINVYKEFNLGLKNVCLGQAYDVEYNNKDKVEIEEYIEMIGNKTSSLLVSAGAIGAILGGANLEQVNNIKKFNHYLGLAFQLQDDYLDLTADEAELGKFIGQDIIEGKKTFMMIRAKELAFESEDLELITKFYDEKGLSVLDIPKVKVVLKKLGIFDEALKLINEYSQKSLEYLKELPDNEYKEMLIVLSNKLMKRRN
jgi:geranylgeranyl pyrophosphate synthase